MRYNYLIKQSELIFKRQLGVCKEIFKNLLKIIEIAYNVKHSRGGRRAILSLEDLLVAVLRYLRSGCSYESLALNYEVDKSNLIRRMQWAEKVIRAVGIYIVNPEFIDVDVIIVDATECPIQRPKIGQSLHFSGKKKIHTKKVQVIISQDGEILALKIADTCCHNFSLFKESLSEIDLSKVGTIYADKGYQGIDKLFPQAIIPIKKKRNKELTEEEKEFNRSLSSKRIKVEHIIGRIKRFKIFSIPYKNRGNGFELRFYFVAAIVNMQLGFFNWDKFTPEYVNSCLANC